MQIIFQVETEYGVFCDALYFPDDAIPSDAEIEALKKERVDNWLLIVKSASEENLNIAVPLSE